MRSPVPDAVRAVLLIALAAAAAEAAPCRTIGVFGRLPSPPGPIIAWAGDRALSFSIPPVDPPSASGDALDPCAGKWIPRGTAVPPFDGYRAIVTDGSRAIVPVGDQWYVYRDRAWRTAALAGGPGPRLQPAIAWIGDRAVVWGGSSYAHKALDDGAIYDSVKDAWTPIPATNAPQVAEAPAWGIVGGKLVAWGNSRTRPSVAIGGIYDPATGAWKAIDPAGAPRAVAATSILDDRGTAIVWSTSGDLGRLDVATGRWLGVVRSDGLPNDVFAARGAIYAWRGGVDARLSRLDPGATAWRDLGSPGGGWVRATAADGIVVTTTAPRPDVAFEAAILTDDERWIQIPIKGPRLGGIPNGPTIANGPVDVRDRAGHAVAWADARTVYVLDVAARRWRTLRPPMPGPWASVFTLGDQVVISGPIRVVTERVGGDPCPPRTDPRAPVCDSVPESSGSFERPGDQAFVARWR